MRKVKLGDCVRIRTGKLDANASSQNGQYPFFTCSRTPLKIDNYTYDCECCLVAGNGDLNVKYYNGKFDAYQRTYIVESKNKSKLDTKYLYYLLENELTHLRAAAIGGVIKYIKLNNLTDIIVKDLLINEQQRIAEELDKVCSVIDKQKKQLALCDELIKSKFNKMFCNKKFEKIKIGSEFEVESGGTPSTKIKEYWDNGTINWIGSNLCQNCIINETDGKFITNLGLQKSSAKVFGVGWVLVALVGATIGKTALLKIETAINQNIAGINVSKNNKFVPEFVFYSIQFIYNKFMEIGDDKFKMANLKFIRNLEISKPPLPLQQQFADFVKEVEKTKLKIKESLSKTETLYKALMQKYFEKGE